MTKWSPIGKEVKLHKENTGIKLSQASEETRRLKPIDFYIYWKNISKNGVRISEGREPYPSKTLDISGLTPPNLV